MRPGRGGYDDRGHGGYHGCEDCGVYWGLERVTKVRLVSFLVQKIGRETKRGVGGVVVSCSAHRGVTLAS